MQPNFVPLGKWITLCPRYPWATALENATFHSNPKERQCQRMFKLLYKLHSFLFPGGSAGKESTCSVGDMGLIPGLGRSSGEGNSYLLQYSGLENSMDYIVHGFANSQIGLSSFHFIRAKSSERKKKNMQRCRNRWLSLEWDTCREGNKMGTYSAWSPGKKKTLEKGQLF